MRENQFLLTFDGVFAGGGTSLCASAAAAAEDMAARAIGVIFVAAGRAEARGREREAAKRHVRSAIDQEGKRK